MGKKYVASDIDLNAMESGVRGLEPPRMEVRDVVQKLAGAINDMRRKGVKDEDICAEMEKHGVRMAPATMRRYLREGKPKARLNYDAARKFSNSREENDNTPPSPPTGSDQPSIRK